MYRVVDKLGPCAELIKGVHLSCSLSGQYQRSFTRCVPANLDNALIWQHVASIDQHTPFATKAAKQILIALNRNMLFMNSPMIWMNCVQNCPCNWKTAGEKMYKKLLALMLILLMVCLSGCGGIKPAQKNSGEIIYSVTDATGQKLSFYEKPQRIISMNVSVDEILLDLVDSKRIAALTYFADDPSICSAGEKVKQVKERVQGSNIEWIVALQPDLW